MAGDLDAAFARTDNSNIMECMVKCHQTDNLPSWAIHSWPIIPCMNTTKNGEENYGVRRQLKTIQFFFLADTLKVYFCV